VTQTTIPGTKVPDVTKVSDAEPDAARRFMSRVAVTTAILATFASLAAMFSTSHLNQAMLDQIKSSDQWAYYQAKGVKLAVLESKMELVSALARPVEGENVERADRYRQEQETIKGEAAGREASAEDHRRRHVTLGRASTGFQIAIALAAIALLSKRAILWHASMVLGATGSVFFVWGLL
jgi:hypothetical protein